MTLNQLRYFCAAARCHSVTQAAKSLYVTQPTITIAIKELEKEFSITLFTYMKNKMELTEEGEKFFERASYLLQCSDEMQAQFSDNTHCRPTVRLGIPPMLSTIFFPELLDAFHEEYPDIYLELSEYGSVRACDLVQDEVLDIGLVNMELYNVDKFSYAVLANETLLFCVSQKHALANDTIIPMGKLDRQPLILFNHDSVQNQLLNQYFHALQIHPQIIMHCSQIQTSLKFVRQGKCGCFFFSSMLPQFPDLIGIPMEPAVHMKVGLVWKKGRYISTYAQMFIRFCEKYYAKHPMVQ